MLDHLCPSCKSANPPGARFCFSCRQPLTLRCPQCSTRHPVAASRCEACDCALFADAPLTFELPRPDVLFCDDADLFGADGADDARVVHDFISVGSFNNHGDTRSPAVELQAPVAAPAPAPTAAAESSEAVSSWRLDRFSSRPVDPTPNDALPRPASKPAAAGASGASPWFWGHTDANTDSEAATLLKLLDIDDSAAATWLPVAPRVPSALMNCQPVVPVTAGQVLKAQRRALVRRARLAGNRPALPVSGAPLHVLVLDTDAVARVELCALLEGFGFRAHPARTTAQAQLLLGLHDIVAAFLAIELDGSDADEAAALCQRVGQTSRATAAEATTVTPAIAATVATNHAALVIVGSGSRPIERVRAQLAGADEFIAKPASRGGLARALDACGVALPVDPRRA